MNYVALQVHTSYSLLTSLNSIDLLVKKAKELGYTSLAITDTNNMFGVMEFYKTCYKYQIKPIIGLELESLNSKFLLYAKNNKGYQNLIKLTTIISNRPLEISDLINYRDNLILVMPSFYYKDEIYQIYDEHYLGYSNLSERKDNLEKQVFINDVRYLNEKDYYYLDYAYMIKEGKLLGEYELNTKKGKHLLSLDEVKKISREEDLINTVNISNNCNVIIEHQDNLLPIYDSKINAFDYLSSLCHKGLSRRLNNNVPDNYLKRLDYELKVIKNMGFCNYFLVVWDYVKYAKQNNILVGPGRGSAAGSLVSYTLGITEIDPIKYDLLFERFLNPERVTMPDIDIDFDADKRDDVLRYVIDKYGEKNVAGIITFNTLAAKQVVRDVGRVLNISLPLVDEISKNITESTLESSYEKNKQLSSLLSSNHELSKLFNIAKKLEGLPRHVSIHAAGVIMSNIPLDKTIPLYYNEIGMYLTGYSANYLEELGLLKMDFLAIKNLTLMNEVINNIRNKEHINITFNNIPEGDAKALKIFYDVNTDGIFQFESAGMKNFLRKLKPNSFEDIYAAIALFRPGPMENIDTYIRRKKNLEKIDYIHPNLEKILKSTYGIIIYQEQIMQIASVMAGYSLGEADILRRAMSKKKEEILEKEKPKFIGRSIQRGYSEETSIKVYNLILKFANYGFNKSHSVAYALVAYKMAFLKAYFYKYFMASLLSNVLGSELKTKLYILELRKNKIITKIPDVNLSTSKYEVMDNEIICPLSIIRNVGSAITKEIIKEREISSYKDIYDFITRIYKKNINKKTLCTLIDAGALSSFGYNKKTLIENIDNLLNYASLVQDISLIEIEKPEIIIYPEYSKEELAVKEFNSFGFYLTNHPLIKYKEDNDISTFNIPSLFNKNIEIYLCVNNTREVVTKKNDVMMFINASDEYGNISLTLFPDVYKKYTGIEKNDIIKVFGYVEKRFDNYQIIVKKIEIIKKNNDF